MSISYRDFQTFAQELLLRNDEVGHRNAASRSYYAAYHACLGASQSLQLPAYIDVSGGTHKRLIQQFVEAKDLKLKSIGYTLDNCKKIRTMADYHLETTFPREDANGVISQTKKLFDRVHSL